MKKFFVSLAALLVVSQALAQVNVELSLDQNQFLPFESIPLTVKITNRSGEQLHLGADSDWLSFDVESPDEPVIAKKGDVPVVEPFDLESSQMATKHVDLQPYFQMSRAGRYKVTATVRIKQWAQTLNSKPIHFDVIHGAELWSQVFGVVISTNQPPEPRKYTLLRANFLREQLRLYLEVSSGDGSQVYRVGPLGPLVSFNFPEAQVDRSSQLHVLWQTGAQAFSYLIIGPDGSEGPRDVYDDFNSRPHLSVTTVGDVVVTGGVRRFKPGEEASLKLPSPTAIPAGK